MSKIKRQVSILADSEESVEEVSRLTGMVVKKAVGKIRPAKADVSGSFTSDALLHAPDSFSDLLALVYKSWLVHGTVTPSLLACAFLPDQEKILALLASLSFHQKPTAKHKNFSIEKVLSVLKKNRL